jgi:flagellar biosynthesis/type III secretory pathway M-ring protein FliF/YscJ
MDVLALLAILVLLLLVVAAVSAPLRRERVSAATDRDRSERDDLEAAREAKYREIRDAELDHRTGKLSEADWRAMDRQLRAEAVEILRRLDELDD